MDTITLDLLTGPRLEGDLTQDLQTQETSTETLTPPLARHAGPLELLTHGPACRRPSSPGQDDAMEGWTQRDRGREILTYVGRKREKGKEECHGSPSRMNKGNIREWLK